MKNNLPLSPFIDIPIIKICDIIAPIRIRIENTILKYFDLGKRRNIEMTSSIIPNPILP
jgi:hypothetical protein